MKGNDRKTFYAVVILNISSMWFPYPCVHLAFCLREILPAILESRNVEGRKVTLYFGAQTNFFLQLAYFLTDVSLGADTIT
jgi:hypothetical protein